MTSAVRKLVRPRWLIVLVLAAVSVPLSLVAVNAASSAEAIPFAQPAHPVIDANWIYDHDWFDATNFIYKVAGSDGCLPGRRTAPPAAARPATPTTCRRTTTARRSSTAGGRASAPRTRRSRTASSASGSRRATTSSRRGAGS